MVAMLDLLAIEADTAVRGRRHRGPELWLITRSTLLILGDGGPVQARGRTWVY